MAAVRHLTAVVPAAGASRRFGSAKLLADLRGEPLLQHTLRSILTGGVGQVVLVAAPDHALASVPLLRDPRVRAVVNPSPDLGMFSSIQVGLAAVGADQAVLVLPADMPFVRATTVTAVIAEYNRRGDALVATHGDRRGHPVVLPPAAWRPLLAHHPSSSLKAALAGDGVVLRALDVDDPGVLRDVDERHDLR